MVDMNFFFFLEYFGLFMSCCVVIFFALAFVKVPWMVGRRLWLGYELSL